MIITITITIKPDFPILIFLFLSTLIRFSHILNLELLVDSKYSNLYYYYYHYYYIINYYYCLLSISGINISGIADPHLMHKSGSHNRPVVVVVVVVVVIIGIIVNIVIIVILNYYYYHFENKDIN